MVNFFSNLRWRFILIAIILILCAMAFIFYWDALTLNLACLGIFLTLALTLAWIVVTEQIRRDLSARTADLERALHDVCQAQSQLIQSEKMAVMGQRLKTLPQDCTIWNITLFFFQLQLQKNCGNGKILPQ